MPKCPCGVNYLPVLFASILFISIITSFVIAVAQSDITPWFPAISDTATKSPESNIFSQLVNISTFIGLILVYVRYLQVKRDVEWLEGGRRTVAWNQYSLPVGLIAVAGASVVANFPETQVLVVHIIAALMLFVFGTIYMWFQWIISINMERLGLISSRICLIRLFLSVLSSASLVICLVLTNSARKKWSGDNLHWHSDDPGYKEHVAGNAFEWVMVFSFLFVFLTFAKELARSRLQIELVGYDSSYNPIPVQSEYIAV